MANMNYCKFENTFNDLQDCYDTMIEGIDNLSQSEKKYHDMMIKLCQDITDTSPSIDKD